MANMTEKLTCLIHDWQGLRELPCPWCQLARQKHELDALESVLRQFGEVFLRAKKAGYNTVSVDDALDALTAAGMKLK